MISPLRELRPGEPITATWLNAIIRQLRAFTPVRSATVRPDIQPGGTSYNVQPVRGGGAAAHPAEYPFQIFIDPNGTDGPNFQQQRTFLVRAGSVNNTVVVGTTGDTPAAFIVPFDVRRWAVYVKLIIDQDTGAVESATLFNSQDGWAFFPHPVDPSIDFEDSYPDEFNFLIGEITTDDSPPFNYPPATIAQYVNSSLAFGQCAIDFTCTDDGWATQKTIGVWRV